MTPLQTTTKPTYFLDASALKESSCILRLTNIVQHGLQPKDNINASDIEYGSAFHLYRKQYEEGVPLSLAIQNAVKYYREVPRFTKRNKQHLTPEHLASTCLAYNEFWIEQGNESYRTLQGDNGKPLVELRFAVPLYADDEVDILGAGTIDAVCFDERAGIYAIKDYKTTHAWDIEEYFSSYEMSPQLMFYTYVLHKYGKEFPNSVIGKACKSTLGAFIDGVFLASSKEAQFKRSRIFFYEEEKLQKFEEGLMRVVHRLVEAIKAPHLHVFPEGNINGTCEKYFTETFVARCRYFDACASGKKESYDMIIENQFVKREYNPLTFGAE